MQSREDPPPGQNKPRTSILTSHNNLHLYFFLASTAAICIMASSPTPNVPILTTGLKPKETLTYVFDPDGDVTLVLDNAPDSLPARLDDLKFNTLGESSYLFFGTGSKILRIRASSKHLTLACPYFRRMFRSKFSEGVQFQSQGNAEIKIHESRVLSFILLMCIVHCRMRQVPTVVSLSALTGMAALVDYYECHDAVSVFSDLWIRALENQLPTTPEVKPTLFSFGQPRNYQDPTLDYFNALNWILISWVFYKEDIFRKMSQYLQDHSTGEITANLLPIPAAIIGVTPNNILTIIMCSPTNLWHWNRQIEQATDCLHPAAH